MNNSVLNSIDSFSKNENLLLIYSPSGHPIYRWLFFFSTTVKKITAIHFESQKSKYRQDTINTRGSWRYMEVLWSETIGLCKNLKIIYNIIPCNITCPELQANREVD